ncbi:peptidoglycan hydrolase-like protein with peptidoglycan-binding domain [Alkalibaculum bacchi]|uniref:Peptidoglycan hydrolase-like protein with peptidoglycan-binding domain n=1 Tax=Alkalibaculum bacchi TaxID=645887 RepID=A0A366I2B9_9FIRM|nr:glycoside hydrolase domain-containing protein [Alkalibaculum bacchi]RBP59922.1 peptidoglycan hydrolase-like protein with peptidoglycan-binding domain [Alkalibaculum bacchi]
MNIKDIKVYEAQDWLNSTYLGRYGYNYIKPDGITGWYTIYALTRALQIELGISEPSDNFGSQTMTACPILSIDSDQSLIVDSNIVRILQSAMFCKGYSPGDITGNFGLRTKEGIMEMQTDANITADGVVTPLLFKSLLTMDAYVLLLGGNTNVRIIQRNLNKDYFPNIGDLIACDGIYGRTTCKAMIMAIQFEGGVSVDGIWGPATQASLPALTYGNTRRAYNYILQYSLYANGFNPNGFDGSFGNGCRKAVMAFQEFCALTVDGSVGTQTWASLMISKGDVNRSATACDCSSTVTPARAATLYNKGYRTVGRYLTGGWKQIQSGEIDTIFDGGLKIFPIYQTSGNSTGYFNYGKGAVDAVKAVIAAKKYGFKSNTIIYFAVDFDALDFHVTNDILPYFRGIRDQFTNMNYKYRIGIYGPRNVCSRVGNAGYSVSSFMADMSTGFSGNLGYPLPLDWNFDQILEYNIGNGDGQIAIDKNICRGHYTGEDCVKEPEDSNEADTVALINNLDGIVNRLGITFTSPSLEIPIITSPIIDIKAVFSVSSIFVEGDGISVTVRNGEIISAGSNVLDIFGAFGINSATLGSILSSWEGIDFKVSMQTTSNSFKINLINQFNAEHFNGIGYVTEKLTIEFKNLDGDILEIQLANAYDKVIEWIQDNSRLILGVVIIAGVVAVLALAGVSVMSVLAALASAISQGIATFGVVIIFMIFFTNKIFNYIRNNI